MFAFFSNYFERFQPPSAGRKTMDLCRVGIALAVLLGFVTLAEATLTLQPRTAGPVRIVLLSRQKETHMATAENEIRELKVMVQNLVRAKSLPSKNDRGMA
jgi:hypothetical protein